MRKPLSHSAAIKIAAGIVWRRRLLGRELQWIPLENPRLTDESLQYKRIPGAELFRCG